MSPQLSTEDQAIITELRRSWRDEFNATVAPLKKQMQALAERTSRLPGSSTLEHAAFDAVPSLASQLLADAGFQAFSKGVLTRTASYGTELRLPPSRKAAAPVSGISPTEYLPQRIWGPAQFPLRLREIMPTLPVGSGTIEYTQETSFTPSAAVVPETTVKPTMAISFQEATAKCATIASIVKVSKQSLADVALMNTWLNVRLGYSVSLKEEDVIINGDATNSIQGLLALATPFVYTPAASDQGMDVIAHAIGQLMGKGYAVDGVILNAADYTAMRLLKTTIGSYIFMGEGGAGPDDETIWEGAPLVWQVPMVVSPSMPAGQFVVGAFAQSTILFSRELLTIEIAFQNEDDFIRNLICLRGELRSGLAVPVPAGVLKGTLPAGSMAHAAPGNSGKK
jgi:HK97 family phage major capsid protein